MHLSTTVMIVVGSGLVLMSAAVLALRRQITMPAQTDASAPTEPATEASLNTTETTDAAVGDAATATPRELHPVAVAIVDREVARATNRRAILG